MGWKSTIDITREQAVGWIMSRLLTAPDSELENALESLGFGDNTELPGFGHNFNIIDKKEDES